MIARQDAVVVVATTQSEADILFLRVEHNSESKIKPLRAAHFDSSPDFVHDSADNADLTDWDRILAVFTSGVARRFITNASMMSGT